MFNKSNLEEYKKNIKDTVLSKSVKDIKNMFEDNNLTLLVKEMFESKELDDEIRIVVQFYLQQHDVDKLYDFYYIMRDRCPNFKNILEEEVEKRESEIINFLRDIINTFPLRSSNDTKIRSIEEIQKSKVRKFNSYICATNFNVSLLENDFKKLIEKLCKESNNNFSDWSKDLKNMCYYEFSGLDSLIASHKYDDLLQKSINKYLFKIFDCKDEWESLLRRIPHFEELINQEELEKIVGNFSFHKLQELTGNEERGWLEKKKGFRVIKNLAREKPELFLKSVRSFILNFRESTMSEVTKLFDKEIFVQVFADPKIEEDIMKNFEERDIYYFFHTLEFLKSNVLPFNPQLYSNIVNSDAYQKKLLIKMKEVLNQSIIDTNAEKLFGQITNIPYVLETIQEVTKEFADFQMKLLFKTILETWYAKKITIKNMTWLINSIPSIKTYIENNLETVKDVIETQDSAIKCVNKPCEIFTCPLCFGNIGQILLSNNDCNHVFCIDCFFFLLNSEVKTCVICFRKQ